MPNTPSPTRVAYRHLTAQNKAAAAPVKMIGDGLKAAFQWGYGHPESDDPDLERALQRSLDRSIGELNALKRVQGRTDTSFWLLAPSLTNAAIHAGQVEATSGRMASDHRASEHVAAGPEVAAAVKAFEACKQRAAFIKKAMEAAGLPDCEIYVEARVNANSRGRNEYAVTSVQFIFPNDWNVDEQTYHRRFMELAAKLEYSPSKIKENFPGSYVWEAKLR